MRASKDTYYFCGVRKGHVWADKSPTGTLALEVGNRRSSNQNEGFQVPLANLWDPVGPSAFVDYRLQIFKFPALGSQMLPELQVSEWQGDWGGVSSTSSFWGKARCRAASFLGQS